jgi:polyisoprenoid-binding protein YceI
MSAWLFRKTIIALFGVVIILLGFLCFQAWNQKVGSAGPRAQDSAGQRELGGGEESEGPPASEPAGGKSRGKEGPDRSAAAFQVDTEASRIYVKVGLATRLGHEHGVQGNLKSGKLALGGDGELVFDMASFAADTPEARKRVGLESKPVSETEAEKVTETMRSAQSLDVNRYPTATYRISAITPLDRQAAGEPGAYRLEGQFTLHGAEKKVQVRAKVERADEGRLKMTGSFTIKQTDYGMKPVSAAGGLAKSSDELEISGDLVLRPAKGK